jgi:predicted nucleic acid-binding protein
MEEMPIMIVTVDRARASRAGALKQKHGLAYADAFAAELAIEHGAWLVTADPEFAKVGQALSIYSLPRYER